MFISGKLGNKHYMTPQLIKLNSKPVCAAVGNAHAIICCSRVMFYIKIFLLIFICKFLVLLLRRRQF